MVCGGLNGSSAGHMRCGCAGCSLLQVVSCRDAGDSHGGAVGQSVVFGAASGGGCHDLSGAFHYAQGSDVGPDRVVRLLGCVIPQDVIVVGADSYAGLASYGAEGGGFAMYKAFHAAFCRQRGSVVFFLYARSGHCQLSRMDDDDSLRLLDLQAAGHVFSCCVLDHQAVHLGGYALFTRHVSCSGIGCGFYQCVSRRKLGYYHLCSMGLAVIDRLAAENNGGDPSGVFLHGQSPEGFLNGVVSFLRSSVPLDLISIVAASHIGLLTRCGELCSLAGDESADGSCGSQRRSVIDLAASRCFHDEYCRIDLDAAVHELQLQFVSDILAGFIPDHDGVCLGRYRLLGDILCKGGRCRPLQVISLRQSAD